MAMTAALSALKAIQKREPTEAVIYSSSEYLVKGMNEWLPSWVAKGWKKKPLNKELWLELQDLSAKHFVSWQYLKGYSEDPLNELAGRLAKHGAGGDSGLEQLSI